MSRMSLGLQLTATHAAADPVAKQLDEHHELIDVLAELGGELICAGQHFSAPELRYLQPLPYLASLASRAPGMQLATGIVLLPLLHPVQVAEDAATVDAISGGRMNLGLGLGYSQHEFDAFQIDRTTRTTRFEEQVAIIRSLWRGDEVKWSSEHFQLPGVRASVLPMRPSGIPIWIGAQAPASVARAARLADAWYVPPFPTHRQLIDLWELFVAERERHGLNVPTMLPVRREVFVVNSKDEARRAMEVAGGRYETYGDWGLDVSADYDEEAWLDSRFIIGDPETVAGRINQLRQRVPISHLVVKPQWPNQPHAEAVERLHRIGTEVVPHLG